eukprot:9483243-Pyramimonas_sp.AAC.2
MNVLWWLHACETRGSLQRQGGRCRHRCRCIGHEALTAPRVVVVWSSKDAQGPLHRLQAANPGVQS